MDAYDENYLYRCAACKYQWRSNETDDPEYVDGFTCPHCGSDKIKGTKINELHDTNSQDKRN